MQVIRPFLFFLMLFPVQGQPSWLGSPNGIYHPADEKEVEQINPGCLVPGRFYAKSINNRSGHIAKIIPAPDAKAIFTIRQIGIVLLRSSRPFGPSLVKAGKLITKFYIRLLGIKRRGILKMKGIPVIGQADRSSRIGGITAKNKAILFGNGFYGAKHYGQVISLLYITVIV